MQALRGKLCQTKVICWTLQYTVAMEITAVLGNKQWHQAGQAKAYIFLLDFAVYSVTKITAASVHNQWHQAGQAKQLC